MSRTHIQVNDSQNHHDFHPLDLIIHSRNIESMEELRSLVSLISDTIHSLIRQIGSSGLSESGARIKILHCLDLVQHSQVGHHPIVTRSFNQLIHEFEFAYQTCFEQPFRLDKPKILSNTAIQSKLDIITDHPYDPIYLDIPIHYNSKRSLNKKYQLKPATPPKPRSCDTFLHPFFHYAPFCINWLIPMTDTSTNAEKKEPIVKPTLQLSNGYRIMPPFHMYSQKKIIKRTIDTRV